MKKEIQQRAIALTPWMNDAYLLRFCRARKFDIDKTMQMFVNFMEFRQAHGLDTILEVSSTVESIFLKLDSKLREQGSYL